MKQPTRSDSGELARVAQFLTSANSAGGQLVKPSDPKFEAALRKIAGLHAAT